MTNHFELAKNLFIEGLGAIQDEDYENAEQKLRSSLALMPDRVSTLTNLSAVLIKLKRFNDAAQILRKVVAIDDSIAEAWLNLGLVESKNLQENPQAIEYFDKALAIDPAYPEAWLNRGIALAGAKKYSEAFEAYDKALELRPDFAEAHRSRGDTFFKAGDKQAAATCFAAAYASKPDMDYLLGELIHAKMHVCDWSGLDAQTLNLCESIKADKKVCPPFALLALSESLALQEKAAGIWTQDKAPSNPEFFPIHGSRQHNKIRIGYYSADFHDHPVAQLLVELLERHDRTRFEVYGLSSGPGSTSALGQRIARAFDQFLDVRGKSGAEIVRLSHEMGIDIAIDLGGHTAGSRTDVFAMRAAPVQVNYLGFPGTMGACYMDYLVTDAVVCPPGSEAYYAEQLIRLPHCFMPHDRTQDIAARTPTRGEFGLPEVGFVFCCFNNFYKINPVAFDIWMRLLLQVEDSVLWLSDGPEPAKINLRKEAAKRGVDSTRIHFARRVENMAEHLARYRLADLFIDTRPYNAHTTACDALWAGVPVLTCMGQSFASRVAGSLLHAVGLPELAVATPEAYEAMALELARDPARLAALGQRLAENRLRTPLFDTPRLTRDIEQAYVTMHERSVPARWLTPASQGLDGASTKPL